jgi:hypothetical protein
MHLKRRARPLLHAPGPLRGIHARRQRIRAQRLVDQRQRHCVRNHACKHPRDTPKILARHRALPEPPRVVRARAQVGQDIGLHVGQRYVPVFVRGFARGQAVQEEDGARGRVDAEGGVGFGFLVRHLVGVQTGLFEERCRGQTHTQPLPLCKIKLPVHGRKLSTRVTLHAWSVLVLDVVACVGPPVRRTLRPDAHGCKRALQLVLPCAKVAQVVAVVGKLSVAPGCECGDEVAVPGAARGVDVGDGLRFGFDHGLCKFGAFAPCFVPFEGEVHAALEAGVRRRWRGVEAGERATLLGREVACGEGEDGGHGHDRVEPHYYWDLHGEMAGGIEIETGGDQVIPD